MISYKLSGSSLLLLIFSTVLHEFIKNNITKENKLLGSQKILKIIHICLTVVWIIVVICQLLNETLVPNNKGFTLSKLWRRNYLKLSIFEVLMMKFHYFEYLFIAVSSLRISLSIIQLLYELKAQKRSNTPSDSKNNDKPVVPSDHKEFDESQIKPVSIPKTDEELNKTKDNAPQLLVKTPTTPSVSTKAPKKATKPSASTKATKPSVSTKATKPSVSTKAPKKATLSKEVKEDSKKGPQLNERVENVNVNLRLIKRIIGKKDLSTLIQHKNITLNKT